MHWKNPADALDLDDELPLHEQINPVSRRDAVSLELHREQYLLADLKPAPTERQGKAVFVCGLQQSTTECPVDANTISDDNLGEWIMVGAHAAIMT